MSNHFVYVDADLKELIPGFFEHRYQEISRITEALAQNDFETIEKIGHSIKGVGGGYGFAYISELGLQIEETAKEAKEEELHELINQYKSYLDNVTVIYK